MDELVQNITRYLLGQLSEPEQAALEEKYFRDPQVFNEVLRVESELVDAYARGQLSTEMRKQFEGYYLKHPSRRDRVDFARALTTRIDEREASATRTESASSVSWWQRLFATIVGQRPRLRFSVALAAVLITVAGVWIFISLRRQQQQQKEAAQIETQRENQERREPEQTAQRQPTIAPPQIPQRSPSPTTNPTHAVAFLTLVAGGVRGTDNGGTQTLIIRPETTQAQIVLKLRDDAYPHYRVSLQKIGGPEIFTQTNLRPRSTKAGANFVFTVPASQLSSGDYALTLRGVAPDGEVDDLNKSLFRVEKR